MTTQNTFPNNDLVLLVSGGQREGEFIPVTTQKCFLGFEQAPDEFGQAPCCAIFRGPHGAVVRSYADEITINGTSATAHWLAEGDQIELTTQVSIEVTQLGRIHQPEIDLNSDGELDSTGDETIQAVLAPQSNSTELASQLDRRLELVEAQICEMQEHSDLTRTQFETLNQRLDELCQQISRIVSATNNGGIEFEQPTFLVQSPPSSESEESLMSHNEPGEGAEVNADGETTSTLNGEQNLAEYSYTDRDSDDERIVTFDPDAADSSESVESVQPGEITDAHLKLKGISQSEIDERLAEMERVFGGAFSEPDAEPSAATFQPSQDEDSTATRSRESLPSQALDAPSPKPLMPHPANDSSGHPFEDLTHSQNEDAESFAVNPTLDREEVFATDPSQPPNRRRLTRTGLVGQSAATGG